MTSSIDELNAAQRLAPSDPQIAIDLVGACLAANVLVCAAHAVRTLLRHADSAHPQLCALLLSARAFGALGSALHWCPHGEPCGRSATNASRDATLRVGSATGVDDGHLWHGEHFVTTMKGILADETLWRGGDARSQLNHGVMQQMQGNTGIARKLYARVLAAEPSNAFAYANLALLERGSASAARIHLEQAIALAPDVPQSGEWWARLGAVHWQQRQLALAQRALRHALRLQPASSFGHALAAEVHGAPPLPPPPARTRSQSPRPLAQGCATTRSGPARRRRRRRACRRSWRRTCLDARAGRWCCRDCPRSSAGWGSAGSC